MIFIENILSNKKKFLILDILNFACQMLFGKRRILAYADEKFFNEYNINFKHTTMIIQNIFRFLIIKVNFISHLSIIDALFHLDKKTEDIIKNIK